MTNDCENVISRMGWGLSHYFIVGLCGMCTLAEASASLIVLIVAPLLACDLKLNSSQTTALSSTSSFGMAIGAFLFGAIADSHGRKGSIPITMVIVFCASIFLAFAQSNFVIHLAIFIHGLGLAGTNTVLRVYLIEFLPVNRRGTCLAILDLLWNVGYLSALGISKSVAPSILRMQGRKFRLNSWRVAAGLGSTPSLIMASLVSLLPASPRYLLYRRRQDEALAVLQEMYAINSSKHIDTFPPSDLENCVQPDSDPEEDTHGVIKTIRKFFRKTLERVRGLYVVPFKRTTILGTLICLLHFPGFIWFALWNTNVLRETKREINSNIMDKYSGCVVDAENMATGFLWNCQEINVERFDVLLLLSLSYVLGELLLCIGIDVIGRKVFLVLSGIIGTVVSVGLIFTSHQIVRSFLSSILLGVYAIGYTSMTILLLESYPTGLRGTAIGIMRILPHTLTSFIKLFLTMPCSPSIIVISGSLLSAAILGLPLHDLTRSPMQE